ncbi:MAG: hypothetical protein KAX99_02305 [Azonexus sp.]|nr:hypothetical protein [Azonexus sp.]
MELLIALLFFGPLVAKFCNKQPLDVPDIWLFIVKNIVAVAVWAALVLFISGIVGRGLGMAIAWLGLIAIQWKFLSEAIKK